MRNVLIYFDHADKVKAIELASQYLKDDGILVVGEAESLSSLSSQLSFQSPHVYQKKNALNKVTNLRENDVY